MCLTYWVHIKIPGDFFKLVLEKNLKYSSSLWLDKNDDLNTAETNMLELYCQKAKIIDGQSILELGCGWGSLTLYLASKYPNCNINAISNSHSQRKFIKEKIKSKKLTNVKIITANIADLNLNAKYDRILSVEMFDHMKNWALLLKKVSLLMNEKAKLFIHIFTHKDLCYHYDHNDPNDWLSKYFFAGGIMPSNNLLLYFQDNLTVDEHNVINGRHYQKTAQAWINNMLNNKSEIMTVFNDIYGIKESKIWFNRLLIFFLSCQRLWGYNHGNEWQVSHYLLGLKK